jgi:hypothetical protein
MSGSEPGPDAELMMPSKEGSGWRPPREPSIQVPSEEQTHQPIGRRARRTLAKLLDGKFHDE